MEVAFEFDASAVEGGKSMVAFERLFGAEGDVIAAHEDMDDANQTVTVASIGTVLVDAADGDHAISPGEVKLVDTVEYRGLVPGGSYRLEGTLVDKATGDPVKDASGKEVTASAEFEAGGASGKAEVTFEFDASKLAGGTSAVAFERLYGAEGNLVASHEDVGDADQTVSVEKPKSPGTPENPEEPTTSTTPTPAPSTPATASSAPAGRYGKTGGQVAPFAILGGLLAAAGAAAIGIGAHRKRKGR